MTLCTALGGMVWAGFAHRVEPHSQLLVNSLKKKAFYEFNSSRRG